MDDQKKKTKGRQKIAMQKIEKESDCYATFSKRRLGLFKKASELSTLCDADVGLFIFSPTGKPFSFFHPSMEAVLSRFRSDEEKEKEEEEEDDDASRLLEAYSRTRVLQLNQMLDKTGEKLDGEVEREKRLDDLVMRLREKGVCEKWWEESAADQNDLEKEQVEKLINLMRNLQVKLSNQREKMVTEI